MRNRSLRLIVIVFASLIALGGLLAKTVEAQVPPIPSFLGGKVIVTGKSTVTGYILTARIGSYESEPSIIKNDFFNLVVATKNSSEVGKPISFWLDGTVESTGVMIYDEKVRVQGSVITSKYGPINDFNNDGIVDSSDVSVRVNGTIVEVQDVNSKTQLITLKNAPSMGSAVYVEYSAKRMSFSPGTVNMNVGIIFPSLPQPTPTPTTIPPTPTATSVPATPTQIPTASPTPTPTPTSKPSTVTPTPGVMVFSGIIAASGMVNLPDNSSLVAKIGDYVSDPAVIKGNEYISLVVAPGRSDMVGKNIEFILNGVKARRTEVYQSSSVINGFDLVFVGLSTPTPSPVSTETATPVPPPVPTATAVVLPPTATPTLAVPTLIPEATSSPTPTVAPTATYEPTSTPMPPTATIIPIIPTIEPTIDAEELGTEPNNSDDNSLIWIIVLVAAGLLTIGAISMVLRSRRKTN